MNRKTLPLLLAAMLVSSSSFAAMPMVTDDTGTQGKERIQVEVGMERQRQTTDNEGISTKTTAWLPSATFTYGLDDRIDLIVGAPWTWQKDESAGTSTTRNGIGDLALQIKWRLIEMEDGRFSFAVKPGVTLPTGNEHEGFGNGKITAGALLIATHKGALGAVHLNMGFTHNSYRLADQEAANRKDIWHTSAAGELNVAGNLRAVADCGLDTNRKKENGKHPVYLLGGMIYSPSGRIDLDCGIKGGLNDAQPATSLLAGMTMHF